MPEFTYEVKQAAGKVEKGTAQGESAQAVARTLQEKGWFVVSVRPAKGRARGRPHAVAQNVVAPIFRPVNSKSLAVFFTSLRVLLGSGMNVGEATEALSRRTSNPTLRRAARDMSEAAAAGQPMSSVFGSYQSAFNETAAALMQAGEESGLIEQASGRLAGYYDRIFQLEQSYRWQTFYPKVLLIALLVIPTLPTLLLGNAGGWLNLLLSRSLPVLAGIIVLWYGWRALMRSPTLSAAVDGVKLVVPWFGNLARRMATARWARAMATLTAAGVPMHRALTAAAAASGNKAMEASLVEAAEGVLEGRTLTEVLTASGAVPGMTLDLLAAAERSGSYEAALEKVAEYYESETEVGGKQTAVGVGTLLYLLIAAIIGIMVVRFYAGYFAGAMKMLE